MRNGWLTTDSIPNPVTSRVLLIPDDEQWIAIVCGAILELTAAYNWEQFGAKTPQECADRAWQMYLEFRDSKVEGHLIGEVVAYAGTTNPKPGKWLPCLGTSILRADFPELFTAIGTTFGAVDGFHFTIPDLRDNAIVGTGNQYTLGMMFGEQNHQLTVDELPSHAHSEIAAIDTLINGGLEAPASAATVFSSYTGYVGSDMGHNNIPPSLALDYYIVAKSG